MSVSTSKIAVSRVQTRSQTRSDAQRQPTAAPTKSLQNKDSNMTMKPRGSKKIPNTAQMARKVQPRSRPAGKARIPAGSRPRQRRNPHPGVRTNLGRDDSPIHLKVASATPELENTSASDVVDGISFRSSSTRDSVSSLDSPHAKDQEGDNEYDEAYLEAQRKSAVADLGEILTVDGSCLQDLYKGTASDRRIKNFLTASSLYDYNTKSWTGVLRAPRDETQLRVWFTKVIKTIIDGLGNVKGTREVVDTSHTTFAHCEEPTQTSRPSISVRATGPSFAEPWVPNGGKRVPNAVGFSNVATVFEVKPDADANEAAVDRLAAYNRQIFFRQLNRLFCRSLLLTETQVRLLHCDRSGAYKTTSVNIHDDPCTFVRLVLGLSSQHEATLGLDSTVQWTIRNGAKVAGTITTVNESGKRIKYQLRMDEPHIVCRVVRSRGTVCWRARDKAGKHIILKDAWRIDEQVPEYVFLDRAKGVAGVTQMFAYEDDRTQTKRFRPECFDFKANEFHNRTMSRVTMACYGSSLDRFTSQRQAIVALRDAIKGHWNLLKAGIMHRDVSMDNILFGDDDSNEGPGGILIDFDMAMVVDGPTAGLLTEYRVGTHLYQSVSVLRHSDQSTRIAPLPRDYLDDLESFLYVLCHLLYGFEGVDLPHPNAFRGLALLAQWEQDRLSSTYSKANFLDETALSTRPIPPFWSSACVELCDSFRKFILPLSDAKTDIRDTRDPKKRQKLLENLYDELDGHYAAVISMFDDAIAGLDRPGGDAPRETEPQINSSPEQETPSAHRSTSSTSDTDGSRKRKSSDSEDGSPSTKRHRSVDSVSP
ncbi:hypothetical protein D9611_006111 [Ephemerocybe angulata]|uniref:Fungal-type protein kinase domain-containing protein n=1 Tax=Ephemerocybe angulata TaxID=980116 RepID=A0A8H5FKY0_9AGAR|nr:hypothetical protein D9611_006111 [Tulosesus angulatus]